MRVCDNFSGIKKTPSVAHRWLLCIAALLPLCGCGGAITGDWKMVSATPNKEILALDNVNFRRDGHFSAIVTIEGKTTNETGTYSFNGFKLTLRPQAGGQRTYNSLLKFNTLEITDKDRQVILQKVK